MNIQIDHVAVDSIPWCWLLEMCVEDHLCFGCVEFIYDFLYLELLG